MKNKKGFTLIELLVTITILGIITIIALPTINRAAVGNNDKKYEAYRKTVAYAGKVYTDSYADDLFGHRLKGCAIIPLSKLIEKKLVTDIQLKNISCNTDKSFVYVNKIKKKYYYNAFIGCGKKVGSEVQNIVIYPKDRTISSDFCDGTTDVNMKFFANPNGYSSVDKKTLDVTVSIQSATGVKKIASANKVSYSFATTKGGTPVTGWRTLDSSSFTSESQQLNDIYEGKVPKLPYKKFTMQKKTDGSMLSGRYYMVLKIDSLYDLFSDPYKKSDTKPYNSDTTYWFENQFTVDNKAPTINSFTVNSQGTGYHSIKPRISLNASDDLSNGNLMTVQVSLLKGSGGWSSWTTAKTYNASQNMTLDAINTYDGATYKVRVKVCDAAGNCTQTPTDNPVIYKVSTKTNVTVNFMGNGAGGNSSRACSYYDNGSCSITSPGISRPGWTIVGWGTSAGATTSAWAPNTAKTFKNNATYYAVTYGTLSAAFVYQRGAEYWNNYGVQIVYRYCTAYNTNSCSISPPQLVNIPATAVSGCDCPYYKLFSVQGWNTNPYASWGTFSPAITSYTVYYSIIVPVAAYVGNKAMFTVAADTCHPKRNSRNVYNRWAAQENAIRGDESYVKEGHGFYWSGEWQVNTTNYSNVDRDDYGWLFLVGKGENDCHHKNSKGKWKDHDCPYGQYIKAYQLQFP